MKKKTNKKTKQKKKPQETKEYLTGPSKYCEKTIETNASIRIREKGLAIESIYIPT